MYELETGISDLCDLVTKLRDENATLTARIAELEAIVGPLVAADDMWTDYGSGFRIHFSFKVGASDEVVERLNTARAAATLNGGNGNA